MSSSSSLVQCKWVGETEREGMRAHLRVSSWQ